MDTTFDPNAPDCSNGDFFCKLCLASMNSEQTWASHIVGRRHIKNACKYPNGLPNRFENEESYDGAEEESYGNVDGYSPAYDDYYYGQEDYYDKKPMDYVPEVRPNVVIDYGHSKKLDEILPASEKLYSSGTQQSKVVPQETTIANVDKILNELKAESLKNGSGVKKKDDFFEKINQRELARDLALELSKSRFYKNEVKEDKSLKPGERSKRKKEDKYEDEKRSKRRSSPDLLDMIHKYNDDKLFKGSKVKDSKESSSSNLEVELKKLDPDKLTPDLLDDLLSSRLKRKNVSSSSSSSSTTTTVKSLVKKAPEIKANLDDPEVLAEKLQKLPNKTFFKIVYNKLKKIEINDSEELKMLLKIVFEAQEVVSKKLPPHVQTAAKAKMSENNSEKKDESTASPSHTVASVVSQSMNTRVANSVPSTTSQTQNAVVSQNYNVPLPPGQNTTSVPTYPPVPTVPQFPNSTPVPISLSFPGSIPSTRTLVSSTQTLPPRFPGAAPNCGVYPSPVYQMQNYQANNAAMFYQMMHSMYQNRQSVPTSNANTVPSTLPPATSTPISNLQSPRFLESNLPSTRNIEAALKQLHTFAEEFKSQKQSIEELKEKSKKESNKESNKESKKYGNEYKGDSNEKHRKDFSSKSSRRDNR